MPQPAGGCPSAEAGQVRSPPTPENARPGKLLAGWIVDSRNTFRSPCVTRRPPRLPRPRSWSLPFPGSPSLGTLARWGVFMTRSTSLVLVLSVPILGLPLLGCAKPARRELERAPPEVVPAALLDLRPEAKPVTPGEDITELVR